MVNPNQFRKESTQTACSPWLITCERRLVLAAKPRARLQGRDLLSEQELQQEARKERKKSGPLHLFNRCRWIVLAVRTAGGMTTDTR